jgi:hypothetical protein
LGDLGVAVVNNTESGTAAGLHEYPVIIQEPVASFYSRGIGDHCAFYRVCFGQFEGLIANAFGAECKCQ